MAATTTDLIARVLFGRFDLPQRRRRSTTWTVGNLPGDVAQIDHVAISGSGPGITRSLELILRGVN